MFFGEIFQVSYELNALPSEQLTCITLFLRELGCSYICWIKIINHRAFSRPRFAVK
jgi:hypothetical protein